MWWQPPPQCFRPQPRRSPANQDTYFTFSAPVELPGATLPAGRYLFVLADSPSNRHVVRVMSEDRKKLYTTVMAIPSYQVGKPSDEPEIRFMEAPENGPHAIKLWIYPGRTTAHEFLYPRSQATRLARATGEPVLTVKTEAPVTETVVDADMTRIDQRRPRRRDDHRHHHARSGCRRHARHHRQRGIGAGVVDDVGAGRAGARRRTLEPAPAPRTRRVDRAELPGTASPLPLIALIGFGALAGSAWMRRSRRSMTTR